MRPRPSDRAARLCHPSNHLQTLAIIEIAPDGTQTPRFTTLFGATGVASVQLQDYLGDNEYLILGQWDPSAATLSTGQISDTSPGTELILYNPAQDRIQVIAKLTAGSDMTTNQTADTLYTAQPNARAVLRIQGLNTN